MKRFVLAAVLSALLAAVPASAQQPAAQPSRAPAAQARDEVSTPRDMITNLQSATANARVRGYSLVVVLADTQGSSMPENLPAPARKALVDVKDFLPYKSYRLLDAQWLAGSDSGGTSSGSLRGPDDASMRYFLAFSRANQQFKLWSADGGTLLLDTSFTEHPGETVVVGTSRVQGDKALVVLLSIVTDVEGVYEPGNGVVAPTVTRTSKPVYTPQAMKARIEGEVLLSAIIRASGAITDIAVIQSLDPVYGLDDQAVKSLLGWEFKPGTKDGKPVDVRVHVTVRFTLK